MRQRPSTGEVLDWLLRATGAQVAVATEHSLTVSLADGGPLQLFRDQPWTDEAVAMARAAEGLLLGIADRVAAEEAANRYRALTAVGFEGICVHRGGVILEVNASLAEIYGYQPAEMVGMGLTELVAPDWLERVTNLVRSGHEGAYRTMGVGVDGERIPMLARAANITWKGAPARVAVFQDQREAMRQREQLAFSEARLAEAQRVARIGSFHVEPGGRVWFSEEARRLLRIPSEEHTLDGLLRNLREADKARLLRSLEVAREERRPVSLDVMLHEHQTADVTITLQPAEDAADERLAISGTIQDISRRLKLESRLVHAQKMEGLGRMAGGVAHDLNNELVGVLSLINLAQEGLAHDHPVQEDLALAVESAEQAGRVVSQLLGFARPETQWAERIDVNEELAQTLRMLRRVLSPGVRLQAQVEERLPAVRLPRGQLHQIVLNLTLNAQQAMEDSGLLTVSARCVRDETGTPSVELTVTDTGRGIPLELQDKVFEPFFTSREDGSGLGLSMVYALVQRGGGQVGLQSVVGQGTSVVVLLPGVREERPAAVPALTPGRRAILLVDDEASVRRALHRLLAAQGHQIYQAVDAIEARALWAQHRTRIGVLLTDVVMPGESGFSLARALAAEDASLGIICMSAYTPEELEPSEPPAGAQFLRKPFPLHVLVDALARALTGPAQNEELLHG